MLESNPIPATTTTTTTAGFTNISSPPTSNTIGSIFTPEQVACVCEVLQQSNDIQRLGKSSFRAITFIERPIRRRRQVIFSGHCQHVNIFITMRAWSKRKLSSPSDEATTVNSTIFSNATSSHHAVIHNYSNYGCKLTTTRPRSSVADR